MTSWYKVEINKRIIYAVRIDDDKLSDEKKLDEAAHLAANHENDFEELICSPLEVGDITKVLNEADTVITH
ncbi:hypothetical protein [Colwellia sp. RSH04]|uniref:hypothetical protein n=1 Tax=Colwellia sp. RSH04 TaxID=2305464 RepID=UPI000E57432C|nr:hypothetical protein [Colwellia sp. RSH04]RHW75780.1 hypothetical protein D1094_11715 [Colwellia sp. RSH04]